MHLHRRVARGLALASAALLFTGCTMGPNPFDYSGPVPNGSSPQNDFRARSNGVIPIGGHARPWPPVVQNDAEEPITGPEATREAVRQVSAESDE